jgi:hypothetical protein
VAGKKIPINRAPVLTLWATVVAGRLGYDADAALTLGRALAGLNAQSKGRRLGIFEEQQPKTKASEGKAPGGPKPGSVRLMGREIPVVKTPLGLRAAAEGQAIEPRTVQTYLEKKFGESLPEARAALESLAAALSPAQLETRAFSLYEKFRPQIPEGKQGWGAKGELDLDLVRSLRK